MLVIGHKEVCKLLDEQDEQVVETVRDAYALHAAGSTMIPHSLFLRFPHHPRDRIIALPAYLRGEPEAAGLKWIASFPGNVDAGLPRASAVVILNSPRTGRPEALLEGSEISARRTGASAALAAGLLAGDDRGTGVALIGCGPINGEVLRYLRVTMPAIRHVTLYDIDARRMLDFAERCVGAWPDLTVSTASAADEALSQASVVSIATTASRPHLDLDACRPGTVVLHVSLRDLTPQAILTSHNIVDDVEHVCREQTSLHRTEQLVGHRNFIHDTIGDLVLGGDRASHRPSHDGKVTVFSPFGLGALDVALATLVCREAERTGAGTRLSGFLP